MSICQDLRLFNKTGKRTEYTIEVDNTYLPSESLAGLSLYWSCRRTITATTDSIALNSILNPSQVYINNASSSIKVILEPQDTINLYPGAYYWEINIHSIYTGLDISYPTIAYGDIIFQRSVKPDLYLGDDNMTNVFGFIKADTSLGDFSYTLPTALSFIGKIFIIKSDDLTGGQVRVYPATGSGNQIDGQTIYEINSPFTALSLYSDGDNWWISN